MSFASTLTIQLFFNFLAPFTGALLQVLAITAALALLKRTQSKGPLLLLLSSIFAIFLNVSYPIFQLLRDKYILLPGYEMEFWFTITCADLLTSAVQLFAVLLIAHEFRSFLDRWKLEQTLND